MVAHRSKAGLDVPVVLFVFNRPDLTARVFEVIRQVRPKELLIVADGPRDHVLEDSQTCRQARDIVNSVDWDCRVLTDFSDVNLGCRDRVTSGINYAFENFDSAIFLEDDCLPHVDFFPYCRQLLKRYAGFDQVMHVGGSQFVEFPDYPFDYFFGVFPIVWGWATWRRAWALYDVDIKNYPEIRSHIASRLKFRKATIDHLLSSFDRTFVGDRTTWDYQWCITLLQHDGICAHPTRNFVRNIGFDSRATHTFPRHHAYTEQPFANLTLPIRHPEMLKPSLSLERLFIEKRYG